jgi:hypothetical protein
MEVRWIPSIEASCFHAAHCVASGRQLLDRALAQQLQPATQELLEAAERIGLAPLLLWRQVLGLAYDYPAPHRLAERILSRLRPARATASSPAELARLLQSVLDIVRGHFPRMQAELPLRIGPLQTAWDTRGPGLLTLVQAMTEPGFLADEATLLIVQPVTGGDGMAHLESNRIHVEGLLTDAQPQLPEALRIGWLLSQLQLERPVYSEQVSGWRLPEVAARALLPIVLTAAEEVQLARCSREALRLALAMWLHLPPEQIEQEQAIILAWWETQAAARYPWGTALAALAQMLAANPPPEPA